MTRTATLVTALLLAATLVGCGSAEQEPAASDSASPSPSPSSEAPRAAPTRKLCAGADLAAVGDALGQPVKISYDVVKGQKLLGSKVEAPACGLAVGGKAGELGLSVQTETTAKVVQGTAKGLERSFKSFDPKIRCTSQEASVADADQAVFVGCQGKQATSTLVARVGGWSVTCNWFALQPLDRQVDQRTLQDACEPLLANALG